MINRTGAWEIQDKFKSVKRSNDGVILKRGKEWIKEESTLKLI